MYLPISEGPTSGDVVIDFIETFLTLGKSHLGRRHPRHRRSRRPQEEEGERRRAVILVPVWCSHTTARPPQNVKRDAKGRALVISGVLPSSVVTTRWCRKDHRPD